MSAIYLEECFWSILQSRCSAVICHTPHGAAVVVWGQPCSQTWPKWWNFLTWAQHPAKLHCILDYFWFGSLAEQVFATGVAKELHRCAPSSYTQWSAPLMQGAALERSASFGGTCQVSAEFTGFATRWKLWFLNVSFFPFFQIQRGAITVFYFTLTSSVLLSKYFEQSFRCVATQRCWHLDKAFRL